MDGDASIGGTAAVDELPVLGPNGGVFNSTSASCCAPVAAAMSAEVIADEANYTYFGSG